jgi:choline dehydrogenase
MNRVGDLRISTAIAYLNEAQGRPNLTVRSGCRVRRVVIEGDRAVGVGVEDEDGGRVETVYAGTIILSAGAIQSPALLMRSGIGPAAYLAALGIDCVVDNPAVGRNLMEHPGSFLFAIPAEGVCDPAGPQYQLGTRYTSPDSDVVNDALLSVLDFWDLTTSPDFQRALGVPMVFAITCGVHQPRSRGRVTITGADHRTAPSVDLNLLSDQRDLDQLVGALRLCHEVARSDSMAPMIKDIALIDDSAFAGTDDSALAAYVRSTVAPWYHVSGTCRMGTSVEDGAVVDQHVRVHGVDGLHVVDASVFPMIPRAPTNLTTIAVAERAATFWS